MKSSFARDAFIWGVLLWLIRVVLAFVLINIGIHLNLIGWTLTPITVVITLYFVLRRMWGERLNHYFGLGLIWTGLAVALDYVVLVQLLWPPDWHFYGPVVYFKYALTLLLPVCVGWWKERQPKLSLFNSDIHVQQSVKKSTLSSAKGVFLAGLLATVISTVLQLTFIYLLVTQSIAFAWYYFGMNYLLASAIGSGNTGGLLGHLIIGTIVLPIVFFSLQKTLPQFGSVLLGIVFGLAIWAILVFQYLPSGGAGWLLSNMGGMGQVIALFYSHLAYIAVLGWGLRGRHAAD